MINSAPTSGNSNTSNATGQSAAPAADPIAMLRAEKEAVEKEREEFKSRYANLQAAFGKQSQEVGALRQMQQRRNEPDEGDYREPSYDDRGDGADPRMRATQSALSGDPAGVKLLQKVDFIDFRLENPDWKDYWGEIIKLVEDPMQSRFVVAFREDAPSVPDYFVTYSNALLRVKYQKLAEKEATQLAAANRLATEKQNLNRLGTSSGSDAGATEEVFEMGNLGTSKEILQKFPEIVDRANPPSMFRRS